MSTPDPERRERILGLRVPKGREPLSDRDLYDLADFAGRMGLVPIFEVPQLVVRSNRRPDHEMVLQKHIDATRPRSRDGNLAKEHLWALGEEVGIARKVTGRLFVQLCFPISPGARYHSDRVRAIPPNELGLDVKTRLDVGMTYPPVPISTGTTSLNVSAHAPGQDVNHAVTDMVIGVDSLIEFGLGNTRHNAEFSPASQDALDRMLPHLIMLPKN